MGDTTRPWSIKASQESDTFSSTGERREAEENATQNYDVDPEDENAWLENRIQASIDYTRSQRSKRIAPVAYSIFKIHRSSQVALTLLYNASSKGLATKISASQFHESYSLSIPPAPRPPHVISTAWFVGLSRAEMRAGPIRTDADVQKAERYLRYKEEREKKGEKNANGRLKIEKERMVEGLKRQMLGLPMAEEVSPEVVETAMAERGITHEELNMVGIEKYPGSRKRKRETENMERSVKASKGRRSTMASKQPHRCMNTKNMEMLVVLEVLEEESDHPDRSVGTGRSAGKGQRRTSGESENDNVKSVPKKERIMTAKQRRSLAPLAPKKLERPPAEMLVKTVKDPRKRSRDGKSSHSRAYSDGEWVLGMD